MARWLTWLTSFISVLEHLLVWGWGVPSIVIFFLKRRRKEPEVDVGGIIQAALAPTGILNRKNYTFSLLIDGDTNKRVDQLVSVNREIQDADAEHTIIEMVEWRRLKKAIRESFSRGVVLTAWNANVVADFSSLPSYVAYEASWTVEATKGYGDFDALFIKLVNSPPDTPIPPFEIDVVLNSAFAGQKSVRLKMG